MSRVVFALPLLLLACGPVDPTSTVDAGDAAIDAADAANDGEPEAPVWAPIGPTVGPFVTAIVVTETSLLVATDPLVGGQGGVYRSTDAGETFVRATGLPEGKPVYDLAVGPDGAIYAGTVGVYASTDDGRSFVEKNDGFAQKPAPGIRAVAVHGGKLYGASLSTVYATDRTTVRWSIAATGLPSRVIGNRLWVAPNNALFLGANATSLEATSAHAIFRTIDGTTWSSTSNGLPSRASVVSFAALGDALFASANALYRSTDQGATWSKLAGSPMTRAIAVEGSTLYAGTLVQGVFRSVEGGPFERWGAGLPSGVGGRPITAIALTATHAFAGTDTKGLWRRPR